jgi:hypothetical protein
MEHLQETLETLEGIILSEELHYSEVADVMGAMQVVRKLIERKANEDV